MSIHASVNNGKNYEALIKSLLSVNIRQPVHHIQK